MAILGWEGRRSRLSCLALLPGLLWSSGGMFFRSADFPEPADLDQPSLEYKVKAAFLLNFTKFVIWPPAAFEQEQSPISICVVGDDPFGRALDQIVDGEAVNGRKVVVERLRRAPPAKTCQVMYVSKSEKDVRSTVATAGPGVLTVGEGDDFLRDGGIIAFVLDNNRVRFDINQNAAASGSLTLSSKLLSVARTVKK